MKTPRSIIAYVSLCGILAFACVHTKTLQGLDPSPIPQESPAPSPEEGPSPEPSPSLELSPTAEASFDPNSITPEMKQETLFDIKSFISELNRITQNRDFNSWKGYLTEDFIQKYSDIEFLGRLSQAPILKRQKISLRTLEDYFVHVVYPSHQNDRVDDIEFIGHNRVKALVLNSKKERLVLWDLEKIDKAWKIGVGR